MFHLDASSLYDLFPLWEGMSDETDVTTGSLVPPFFKPTFFKYIILKLFLGGLQKKKHLSFYMPLDHAELPFLFYVTPSYVMLNFCMAKHLFLVWNLLKLTL